jgi:hypothetical protein
MCYRSSWRRFAYEQSKPREVPLAAMVEIAARAEADVPLLFGLAKSVFAGLPGWSDERVLEVLRGDLVFVAREQGLPAGYVALHRADDGAIVIEQLSSHPAMSDAASGTDCSPTRRATRSPSGPEYSGSSLKKTTKPRAASTAVRASRRPSGSCSNGCSRAPTNRPSGRWRQWQPES